MSPHQPRMTSTVSVQASQRCTDRHRLGPNIDFSTVGPPHSGHSGVLVPICTATVNSIFNASLPRTLKRSGDHAGLRSQETETSSIPSTAKTAASTSSAIIARAGHPENVGIRPMPTIPFRTSTCSSNPRSTIDTPGYSGSSIEKTASRTGAMSAPPSACIRTEWTPPARGERSSRSEPERFRGSRPEVSRCSEAITSLIPPELLGPTRFPPS